MFCKKSQNYSLQRGFAESHRGNCRNKAANRNAFGEEIQDGSGYTKAIKTNGRRRRLLYKEIKGVYHDEKKDSE